jgi:ADP-heptose:LPS heptosyltransferase
MPGVMVGVIDIVAALLDRDSEFVTSVDTGAVNVAPSIETNRIAELPPTSATNMPQSDDVALQYHAAP